MKSNCDRIIKPRKDWSGYIGKKYGRWTILEYRGKDFLCRCDCGTTRLVKSYDIRTGYTKSCGCYDLELKRKRKLIHGMSESLTYNSWRAMIDRTTNPKSTHFNRYGGRGIRVCERWLSFENFLVDMGERPPGRYSIDRINNNGNYEPSNCRWATDSQQQLNRCECGRILEYMGERKNISQWSKDPRCKVGMSGLFRRIKDGWNVERAITAEKFCHA